MKDTWSIVAGLKLETPDGDGSNPEPLDTNLLSEYLDHGNEEEEAEAFDVTVQESTGNLFSVEFESVPRIVAKDNWIPLEELSGMPVELWKRQLKIIPSKSDSAFRIKNKGPMLVSLFDQVDANKIKYLGDVVPDETYDYRFPTSVKRGFGIVFSCPGIPGALVFTREKDSTTT